MSYILEALKKAQAERQLGHSPTIHAPTLQAGVQAAAGSRLKQPVVLVVAAMAVVIAVLAVLVWRPAAPVAVPAVAVAPGGLATPASRANPTNSANQVTSADSVNPVYPANSVDPSVTTAATQPLPAPVAALPPPVATAPVLPQPPLAKAPALAQPQPPVAPAAAAPAVVAAAVKAEEPVLNLRELPEPIQRAIPQVAVGGYIYSKNPADRLLLVDKILRREGEEVAPGLLLEKLHPKEAIFSYKGYRYRVPY
jgi:general secretion pathway protein B